MEFITLLIGMMVRFPSVALALLAGFSAATGPTFADMAVISATVFLDYVIVVCSTIGRFVE